MRGILLAGGTGSRLWPTTSVVNKHLIPVFNKPMIYYPLTTLIAAGVSDILVITDVGSSDGVIRLLGDGGWCGVALTYAIQTAPRGIPDAFLLGRRFIGTGRVLLVLGDNLLYGVSADSALAVMCEEGDNAVVFATKVPEPWHYGVLSWGEDGSIAELGEKRRDERDWYAIPGIYSYPSDVVQITEGVVPSERGELEIQDVNERYRLMDKLSAVRLPSGVAWSDVGTAERLAYVSDTVAREEMGLGTPIGYPEMAALGRGLITAEAVRRRAARAPGSDYSVRLLRALVTTGK